MSTLETNFWFAFGENADEYFFWGPSGYKYSKIPSKLSEAFRTHGVKRLFYLALGADVVAVAAWKTSDGGWQEYTSNRIATYGSLNSQLVEWRSQRNWCISVSLAAKGNYVACQPDLNGVRWHEDHRPEDFAKWMRHYKGIKHVALGVGGEWVLIRKHGDSTTCSYKCSKNYPVLDAILGNLGATERVTFVALNPWRHNQYFLVVNNNTAYYSVDTLLKPTIVEILRENNLGAMGMVNNTNGVSSNSRDFWQEITGHAVGGATGAVVTGVFSSCAVM